MLSTLTCPALLRTQAFIGEWTGSRSGLNFPVVNPANGDILADAPRCGAEDVRQAIDLAEQSLPSWANTPVKTRAGILRQWSKLLGLHLDDLARILTQEQGKPFAEARGEILYAASFLDYYADIAGLDTGHILPAETPGCRMTAVYEPVGIGAAITPWNFPAGMVTRKLAPALAAGCPVILKPSEWTPLTALALAGLGLEAGVPPGALAVVTGASEDAAEIGGALMADRRVRKVSFTGSTRVGKILAAQGAETMKRLSLELGGNAPFIIFDDVDLDAALKAVIGAKFRNAGQTCVSANRIFVQRPLYDAFCKELAARAKALSVGDGLKDGVKVGPLINAAAVEKVERHVADAREKGAQCLCGGKPHEAGPLFYEPTVLRDVTPDMAIYHEETFGPVAALIPFEGADDVITAANDTPYGLAAYYFTHDKQRAARLSRELQAGILCENTIAFSSARAPFGGYKESGIGREGGVEGLNAWREIKYLCQAEA